MGKRKTTTDDTTDATTDATTGIVPSPNPLATGWNATAAAACRVPQLRIMFGNSACTIGLTMRRGVSMADAIAYGSIVARVSKSDIHTMVFVDHATKLVFGAYTIAPDGTVTADPDALNIG